MKITRAMSHTENTFQMEVTFLKWGNMKLLTLFSRWSFKVRHHQQLWNNIKCLIKQPAVYSGQSRLRRAPQTVQSSVWSIPDQGKSLFPSLFPQLQTGVTTSPCSSKWKPVIPQQPKTAKQITWFIRDLMKFSLWKLSFEDSCLWSFHHLVHVSAEQLNKQQWEGCPVRQCFLKH